MLRSLAFGLLVLVSRPTAAKVMDEACAAALEQAEARSSQRSIPSLTVTSQVEPGAGERREETLRVGLEMQLSDLVRSRRARARAEADCLRFEAEHEAEVFGTVGRADVELKGLAARKEALDGALVSAKANLAERHLRLAASRETRAGVGRAAAEVAALARDLVETTSRMEIVKRQTGGASVSARESSAVLASLAQTTRQAERAAAAESMGPAWDVTLAAGWARTRYASADGELEFAGGPPLFGSVGLRWRPGVAFAKDAALEKTVGSAKLAASVEAWEADRKTMVAENVAKLALVSARTEELRADLGVLAASRSAELRDYEQMLERDLRALSVEEADLRGRLVAAGPAVPEAPASAVPAAPAATDTTVAPPMKLEKLVVTEGAAKPIGRGMFATDGAKIRAYAADAAGATGVHATFKYLGPSASIVPLKGGEARRQLGVFLAAKDQCNLLYAMWRLPAEGGGKGELVVQRKLNPGKSTHKACGNGGYTTVKAARADAVPVLSLGDERRLDAVLDASRLAVSIDGRVVWEGPVDLGGLDPKAGKIGWRSDNVVTEFSLAPGGAPP